jgi:hypothetical protein
MTSLARSDIIERARASLAEYEAGILADYVPYSPWARATNARRC